MMLFPSLACLGLLCAGGWGEAVGYLHTPMRGCDGMVRDFVEPYYPQEGDLLLSDDHLVRWKVLYWMGGTAPPNHACLIVRDGCGRPVIFDMSPDRGHLAGPYAVFLDVCQRLHTERDTIYIRRARMPLTPCQSAQLTCFAQAQLGKGIAGGRLMLQATPLRCHGSSVVAKCFGKTDLQRERWLCSELVVAACTVIGWFDPQIIRANTIYPRDLLDNQVYQFSCVWLPAAIWSPCSQPLCFGSR